MKLTIGEYEYTININDKLLELGDKLLNTDANMMPFDCIVGSVIKKSIRLNDAFFMLLEANNYEGAMPLIRVQMENANYLCAACISDINYFYDRLVNGKPINQMTDLEGNQLTTNYLVDRVTENFPAFRKIWDQGNKYIHPSEAMVKAMVNVEFDEKSGQPKFIILKGLNDETFTDNEKTQILISMMCVNEAIEGFAEALVNEKLEQVEMAKKDGSPSKPLTKEEMEKVMKMIDTKFKPLEGGSLVNPLFDKNGNKI